MSKHNGRRGGGAVSTDERAGLLAGRAEWFSLGYLGGSLAGWTRALGGAFLAAACAPALAGPEGAQVVKGQVSISRSGSETLIRAGRNSIINYKSFDIGAGESVRFVQPDAKSRVLNRIESAAPTRIDGGLFANGRVYIVNPAGVVFGNGARVNVAGLYAAGGHLSNSDFSRGKDNFTGLTGDVVNRGTLTADFAGLIGRHVANSGTIIAPHGAVVMAAGSDVLVGEARGNIFVRVKASGGAGGTGLENTGLIDARGGQTMMGAGDMYALALNTTGAVIAKDIKLEAFGAGKVAVSGTLNASNQGQGRTGGSVSVTGEQVSLINAKIEATGANGGGTVRIGGDYQGTGDMRRATATTVDAQSTIDVSATRNGDGGQAVVWSDVVTRFGGQINARGGAAGGDGGNVEVSGKEFLAFGGKVDTLAPKGATGNLLLDPRDITIQAVGAQDTEYAGDGIILAGDPGIPPSTDFTLTATLVSAATTNIDIAATRDININAAVNMTGAGLSFTANAGRDLTVNAALSTTGGDISLTAGRVEAGAVRINAPVATNGGNITLNPGTVVSSNVDIRAAVTTLGGSFTSAGADFTTGASPGTPPPPTTHGTINTWNSSGPAVSGAVTLNHTGTVTIGETITAGTVEVHSAATAAGTTLSANVTTRGGAVRFFNPVTLGATAAVDTTNAGGTAAGANIAFDAGVNGAQGLTLAGGTAGDITLGDVGQSTRLGALAVTSANSVSLGAAAVTGLDIDTSTLGITLTGGIIDSTAAVRFRDVVTLSTAPTTITTISGAATGANIRFDGTLNGSQNLTLGAGTSGVITVGSIGQSTRLGALTVTSGNTLSLGAAAVNGLDIDLSAGAVTLTGGTIDSTAAVRFADSVSLTTAATTITTTSSAPAGANIAFESTLNGGQNLTLVGGTGGLITFGTIGGTARLGSLTVSSANTVTLGAAQVAGLNIDSGAGGIALTGGTIDSTAAVIFQDAVTLSGAGTTITTTTGAGTGANIRFDSTVNGTAAGAQPLTLRGGTGGAITFTGAVGGTTRLGALAVVNGSSAALANVSAAGVDIDVGVGGISLGGTVDSTSAVIFRDAVTLTGATSVVTTTGAATGANITFSSTVDGAQTLTLDGGTGGDVTFSGAVGSGTRTGNITITAARNVALDDVSTATAGGAFLSITNSGTATLNGLIDLGGAFVKSSGGSLLLNAVGGDRVIQTNRSNNDNTNNFISIASPLTMGANTGSYNFNSGGSRTVLGSTAAFGGNAITITADEINFTGGAGSVTGTSTLTLAPATGVAVVVGAADNSAAGLDFTAQDLAAIGAASGSTFSNVLIDGTSASSLTANAATFRAPTTLRRSGGMTVSGDLTGTTSGAGITLDGPVTFSGTPRTIATNGGLIQINGTANLGAAGAVTLDTTVGSAAGANIGITGDITGAGTSLTARGGTGGTVTLGGAVGTSGSRLGAVTITGLTTSLGSAMVGGLDVDIATGSITLRGGTIDSTGAVRFRDGVALTTASTTINSGGTNISFDAGITGSQALTLAAGAGDVHVVGAVGATGAKLGALTITSAANASFDAAVNAASITQTAGTGTTTFTGVVDASTGAISLTGNNFTFSSTVHAAGATTIANAGLLTLSGVATLDGGLAQTGAGAVSLAGGRSITAINAPISFAGATTVTGTGGYSFAAGTGGVTFGAGATLGVNAVTISAGEINFSGAANSVTGSAALTLQPAVDGTAVVVGGASDSGVAVLDLTTADLAALADGFTGITIGRGTGVQVMTINSSTFRDPILLRSANVTGAALNVTGVITGTGNASVTLSGPTVFSGVTPGVTTANQNIQINGTASLASATTTTLNSGSGNIGITGAVTATAANVSSLTLTAPAGDVLLSGSVGTTGAPLLSFTVTSADDVTTGSVTARGITQGAGTGTSTYASLNAGSDGVNLTGNNFIIGGGSTSGDGLFTIQNLGLFTLNGTLGLDGAFSQSGGGSTVLNAGITTTNDSITFANDVDVQASIGGLDAGTATLSFGGDLHLNANNFTLSANTLTFGGGSGSVDGTGIVTLTGATDATPIGVGVSLGAGALNITSTTVDALADGFAQIIIGRTGQSGTVATGNISFRDPVLLRSPSGLVSVRGTLTGTDNASVTLTGPTEFNASGSDVPAIVTAGDAITINGAVSLVNTGLTTLDTGTGADVTITGAVTAAAAGVSGLSIDAGSTGDVLLGGSVGAGNALSSFTIVDAADVTAQFISAGGITQQAGSGLSTFGLLTAGSGGISLTGNGFTLTAGGSTSGGGDIDIENAGTLTISDDVTSSGEFTQGQGSTTRGPVALNADVTTTGGDLTFFGTVTAGGTANELDAGADTIRINGIMELGATNFTFTARDINFSGADTVRGTGTLLLQPDTDGTSIGLGAGTGSFTLTQADFSALRDGFTGITVGRATGTHAVVINNVTFRDPTVVRAPNTGGSILVNGSGLTGSGNGSITLTSAGNVTVDGGGISSSGTGGIDLTSTAGAVNLIAGVTNTSTGADAHIAITGFDRIGLGAAVRSRGTAITLTGPVVLTANSSVDSTFSLGGPGGGGITFTSTINATGAGGQALTLNAGTNTIGLGGDVGTGVRLGQFTVTDGSLLFSQNRTVRSTGATIGGDVTVSNNFTLDGAAGTVILTGDIDTRPAAFTVVGGTVTQGGNVLASTYTVTGTTITQNGGVTAGTYSVNGGVYTQNGSVFATSYGINGTTFTQNGVASVGAYFAQLRDGITINGDITATGNGGVALRSGTDGTGDITFGSGVDVSASQIRMRAGSGTGTGSINAAGNSPNFRGASGGATSPAIFEMTQDASVTAANLPGAGRFGGGLSGTSYIINSRQGGVTLDAAAAPKLTAARLDLTGSSGISFANGTFSLTSLIARSAISYNNATVAASGEINNTSTTAIQGAVTLRARELQLGGAVTPASGASLAIEGAQNTTDIFLGGNGAEGTNALHLTAAKIARLGDGFSRITIGSADSTGTLTVQTATAFTDPVTLSMGSGSVLVNAPLSGTGNASLTIDAGTTRLASNLTTAAQDIAISGALVIAGNVAITAAGGTSTTGISLGGPIDADSAGANRELIVNAGAGSINSSGDLGLVTLLRSFTATASEIFLGRTQTTGAQAYNGNVTLDGTQDGSLVSAEGPITITGDLTLNSDTVIAITQGGAITIGGSVGSDGTARDLTLDGGSTGSVTVVGDIGGTANPGTIHDLTVTSGDNNLGGINITGTLTTTGGTETTGDITGAVLAFADGLVLTRATTLTGTTSVTLGTVNSEGSETNDLTINSPVTVLGGAVGATQRLGTLTTDAAGTTTIRTAEVHTEGQQTFNDAVSLDADTVLWSNTGGVRFAGTVDSVNGNHNLTVNTAGGGVTRFDAAVGATTQLGSVIVDAGGTGNGTIVFSDTINTTGAQTYNDAVTLADDAGLSGNGITFNSTIDSGSAAHTLTLAGGAGGVSLNAAVGGTSPLDSLEVTGSAIALPEVNTSNGQSYTGTVTLNGNLTSTSDSAAIDITGPLFVAADDAVRAHNIFVSGAVNSVGGAHALTLTAQGAGAGLGSVTLSSAVGSAAPLSSFTVTAARGVTGSSITTHGVTTTGNQVYNGDLSADQNLTASGAGVGSISVTGELTLGGPVTVSTTDGDITFTATIDGAQVLTTTAGVGGSAVARKTTFGGVVGGSAPLAALNAGGATAINTTGITTTGAQTFSSAVTLGDNPTLTGSNLLFGSTLDNDASDTTDAGARNLTLNSTGNGETRFSGIVGGINPLGSITTNADGTTRVSTSAVTTRRGMDLGDNVRITTNSRLDGGSGSLFFHNTLQSEGAETDLTLRSTAAADATGGTNRTPFVFGQSVGGTGTSGRFRSLSLGADRGSSPASAATAVFAHGFQNNNGRITPGSVSATEVFRINTGSGGFTMGRGQKLTAFGALEINTTGTARIGDLTSLSTITVQANAIEIQLRQGGAVTGNNRADTGVDFVAPGDIKFLQQTASGAASTVPLLPSFIDGNSRSTTVPQGFRVSISNNEGRLPGQNQQALIGLGITLQRFKTSNPSGVTSALFRSGDDFLPLDLAAEGNTPRNVATTIAGAIPRDTETREVATPVTVGKGLRDELKEMGVNAIELSVDDLVEFMIGRSLYLDLPLSARPETGDYRVTVNRVSLSSVQAAVDAYRALVFVPVLDSEGNPQMGENGKEAVRNRSDDIKETLAIAWESYSQQATDPDGAGFRAYLESKGADGTPAEQQSLDYLRQLHNVMVRLDALALSKFEASRPKLKLMGEVRPPNITEENFQIAVDGVKMSLR